MILKKPAIRKYREEQIRYQRGICPILLEPYSKTLYSALSPVLDHKHGYPTDPDRNAGRVRTVISQNANTYLGYVENAWKKYCARHTKVSLPDALRAIADYLDWDWTVNPYHPAELEKMRKKIKRLKVGMLRYELQRHYDTKYLLTLRKPALVKLYMEHWKKTMYPEED